VSITNSGNADLHISAVGLQENGSSDFVLNPASPCSGLTVPAGGTCGFTVTFAPQALYQRSASIAISDDAYNSPQHVNLLGTGTDAIGLANPSSVDFGTVNGGASSFVATVTVSNSGNDVLHVASVTVSDPADFAVSADYCSGMAINPNSTCTVGVFFQPQTFGSFTSTLTVNDDAFNGPSQVSLRGTGVAGHPSFNPANVAFGAVKVNHLSSLQPVVATNVGNASLHVGTLSIQGQNSRDFFIAQDSCSGTTLAPGTSCTVQLVFRPTAQGTRSAYVLFADDDPLGAATIALSGTGSKA
jgi:hypothetical protein